MSWDICQWGSISIRASSMRAYCRSSSLRSQPPGLVSEMPVSRLEFPFSFSYRVQIPTPLVLRLSFLSSLYLSLACILSFACSLVHSRSSGFCHRRPSPSLSGLIANVTPFASPSSVSRVDIFLIIYSFLHPPHSTVKSPSLRRSFSGARARSKSHACFFFLIFCSLAYDSVCSHPYAATCSTSLSPPPRRCVPCPFH